MSRIMHCSNRFEGCFPRVSGDEPVLRPTAVQVFKFSPRERG